MGILGNTIKLHGAYLNFSTAFFFFLLFDFGFSDLGKSGGKKWHPSLGNSKKALFGISEYKLYLKEHSLPELFSERIPTIKENIVTTPNRGISRQFGSVTFSSHLGNYCE